MATTTAQPPGGQPGSLNATGATIVKYQYGEWPGWSEVEWLTTSVLVAIHLVALGTLVYFPATLQWPSWKAVLLGFALGIVSTLGVTAGNHRYWTHEGYKTYGWFEAVLLVAAAFTIQGTTRTWVETHWVHHEYTDRPGDKHSPYQHHGWVGIFWAHIGWLFFKNHLPDALPEKRMRISSHLLIKLQHWLYPAFFVASFGVPYIVCGWQGLFIAGFLRIAVELNITWCINSICHLYGKTVKVKFITSSEQKRWEKAIAETPAGQVCEYQPTYRVRHQGDGSRNNRLLAIIAMGEGNHAMHHLFERVAYHAWKGGIDATRRLLIILEFLHIVWDVQKPPPDAIVEEAALRLPDDSLLRKWREDPRNVSRLPAT